jgi:site-specific DNA recombinase
MGKRIKPGNPQVAVAYIRVSKEEQRLGPEAQRVSVEAWAAHEGVHVAAWCVDQGVCSVTGIEGRPALLAAMAAVREHGAGFLVVARRDRIARDVVVAATVERAAAACGAQLVSAAGEGNGNAPADEFMRGVIDCAAQYERGIIRARTKAALATKRTKGERISGGIPYGFALAPDSVHFIAAQNEHDTIGIARALSAEGRSLRGIACELAGTGRLSRTGRPFAPVQVARMLAGARRSA